MVTTSESIKLEGNDKVYAVGGHYYNSKSGVAYFDVYVLDESVSVPDDFEVRRDSSNAWYLGNRKCMSSEIKMILKSAGYGNEEIEEFVSICKMWG